MSMTRNDLKKEKPTDGEIEVLYHTKASCIRAVHLGRQRVFIKVYRGHTPKLIKNSLILMSVMFEILI